MPYTAGVTAIYLDLLWIYCAISFALIVICGYISSTASDGPGEWRARFIATLSFASWFIVAPSAWELWESHLPTFEFSGAIAAVRVERQSSRHYSAWLTIQTTLGGDVSVHTSDANAAWVPGQRLRIRYFGDTGELIHADLLDASGNQTGEVNSTAVFSCTASVLLGLFLCWAGWRRYKRDANGTGQAEEDPDAIPAPDAPDLNDEELDKAEMAKFTESARRQFAREKRRMLVAGAAFVASCGLASLFLHGHSLHRYLNSAGGVVLALCFAFMIAFTITSIAAVGSWLSIRRLEQD
jgi:hypothetical protein